MNAISNCNRKKGRKIIPLWKKKQKRANTEKMQNIIAEVEAEEKKSGKSWVEKIYEANGRTAELRVRKDRKKKGGVRVV